jgi:hypothetical protein
MKSSHCELICTTKKFHPAQGGQLRHKETTFVVNLRASLENQLAKQLCSYL